MANAYDILRSIGEAVSGFYPVETGRAVSRGVRKVNQLPVVGAADAPLPQLVAPPAPAAPSLVAPRVVTPSYVPPAPDLMGPGVPIGPSDAVYGTDLPALPIAPSFTPAPTRDIPTMYPSPSRRFSSTRPQFIYTNPVAAQQAAQNHASELAFEANQDQGYRDYLARLNAENALNQRANVQGQVQQQQLGNYSRESSANRASAERIAINSELVRQHRMEEQMWAENERAAEVGEQTAAMLNQNPAAKVDKKWAYLNPGTGLWESRFHRKPRPAPPVLHQDQPPIVAPLPHWQQVSPVAPPPVAPSYIASPAPDFLQTDFGPRVTVPSPPPAPMIGY